MRCHRAFTVLSVILVSLVFVEVAAAATVSARAMAGKRDVRTTIQVKGIHCQFCASKLSRKLKSIPGVSSAKVDAKKAVAVVTPKDAANLPSPRAQWEAIEKAGYKPVKMTGPFGTFTKKPEESDDNKSLVNTSSKPVRRSPR